MADAAAASTLVELIPVIVGGAIAIAGGLIGPPVLHLLERHTAKERKRAEKFEELVTTLHEHSHWLDSLKGFRVFGREGQEPPSPMAKIRTICTVYFPQFDTTMSELEIQSRGFEMWMLDAGLKRLQGGKVSEMKTGMAETYNPYFKKFLSVQKELQAFAKTEFQ
jgi:hypothetical protein